MSFHRCFQIWETLGIGSMSKTSIPENFFVVLRWCITLCYFMDSLGTFLIYSLARSSCCQLGSADFSVEVIHDVLTLSWELL